MPKVAEPKQELKMTPVKAANVRPQEMVDDDKFYRVIVQLGKKWGKLPGHKFKTRVGESASGESQTEWECIPTVSDAGVLSGRIVNGLISSQNRWVKRHSTRHALGRIQDMTVVLDAQETDKLPEKMTPQLAQARAIATETGKAIVAALIEAGVIKT